MFNKKIQYAQLCSIKVMLQFDVSIHLKTDRQTWDWWSIKVASCAHSHIGQPTRSS